VTWRDTMQVSQRTCHHILSGLTPPRLRAAFETANQIGIAGRVEGCDHVLLCGIH
jgi:hypothetical protein